MTKNKAAKTELTTLALELIEGSRRRKDILDSEESVLRLKNSLDSKIIPQAIANREMGNRSAEMAWGHFVS